MVLELVACFIDAIPLHAKPEVSVFYTRAIGQHHTILRLFQGKIEYFLLKKQICIHQDCVFCKQLPSQPEGSDTVGHLIERIVEKLHIATYKLLMDEMTVISRDYRNVFDIPLME